MIKILGALCIICSILCIYGFLHFRKEIKNIHKINYNIDELNKKLSQEVTEKEQQVENLKNKLYNINKETNDKIYFLEQRVGSLNNTIEDKQKQLDNLQQNVTKTVETQKQLSQTAFENYCEVLIKSYDEKEKEYEEDIQRLQDSYFAIQENINKDLEQKKMEIAEEVEKERKVLDKIRETRAAAIQAQIREQEVKEKLAFYCLTINDSELDDIKVLERVKGQLHAPRILSMLIWQTYFQKPMTSLCNNIIGTGVKSGIYKITNQKTDICYIGQATNLSDRWKQHAKCGLGIDTPQGNKLYKAMKEDGLWNFSFEVLEFCSPAELNEKEKYYIELYQSKDFGYNTQAGNNK